MHGPDPNAQRVLLLFLPAYSVNHFGTFVLVHPLVLWFGLDFQPGDPPAEAVPHGLGRAEVDAGHRFSELARGSKD